VGSAADAPGSSSRLQQMGSPLCEGASSLGWLASQTHRVLPRAFYDRDPLEVAPDVLGKVLVSQVGPSGRAARIVEVEAYRGGEDPASHAFRGRTRRNAAMFGPPGHLYVYFTYGMHFCANVVCWPEGRAGAVLLRAAEPLEGIEAMRCARAAARTDSDLASGPAKLCQAFGFDRSYDGMDLVPAWLGAASQGAYERGAGPCIQERGDASRSELRAVWMVDDGWMAPYGLSRGIRIGLSRGVELEWRWWVTGDPNISR